MEKYLLTWKQRGTLWLRLGIRLALALLLVWSWKRFGRALLELTMPFLLAWLLALLLDPLVKWAERRTRLSRRTVTLAVLLFLLALLGGGAYALVYYAGRELMALVQDWDSLVTGFQSTRDNITALFARLFSVIPPELTQTVDAALNEVLLWIEDTIPAMLKGLGARATDKFKGAPAFGVAVLMFVLGTYFITADYPRICGRTMKRMGRGTRQRLRQVRATAFTAFGGYLKAQVLLSCGVFCILLLGFLLTGQSYSLLLALFLAVVDFLPLLGAGVVMIPWAVFALVSREYGRAVTVAVIWGVITLYRRTAEPKVVGDQTGLSPILSLFSIYIGMKLGGVAGMILGPVLLLVAVNLARSGMFDAVAADLRAAAQDLGNILKQR